VLATLSPPLCAPPRRQLVDATVERHQRDQELVSWAFLLRCLLGPPCSTTPTVPVLLPALPPPGSRAECPAFMAFSSCVVSVACSHPSSRPGAKKRHVRCLYLAWLCRSVSGPPTHDVHHGSRPKWSPLRLLPSLAVPWPTGVAYPDRLQQCVLKLTPSPKLGSFFCLPRSVSPHA